jgi:hypothetical protein
MSRTPVTIVTVVTSKNALISIMIYLVAILAFYSSECLQQRSVPSFLCR